MELLTVELEIWHGCYSRDMNALSDHFSENSKFKRQQKQKALKF